MEDRQIFERVQCGGLGMSKFYVGEDTDSYKEAVRKYYEESIESHKFGCEHYESCKGKYDFDSVRDSIKIGSRYGDFRWKDKGIEKPLRTLVVGLEGIDQSIFEEKNKVPFRLTPKSTIHIVGVLKTLMMLYNVYPSGIDDENVLKKKWMELKENGCDQLYDYYALANIFKCIFKTRDEMEGNHNAKRHNKDMKTNCPMHLVKEIELLKPTIVILQSTKGSWGALSAIKNRWRTSEHIDIKLEQSHKHEHFGLYQFDTDQKDWGKFFLQIAYHPASRGKYTWRNYDVPYNLLPSIRYLRDKGIIPQENMWDEFVKLK
jgi:hypothetical protein